MVENLPRSSRTLLVVNPVASSVNELLSVDAVIERCSAFGLDSELLYTVKPGSAVTLVSSKVADAAMNNEQYRLVIAIGGDGTTCQVAEGIVRGLGGWPKEYPYQSQLDYQHIDSISPVLMVLPGGTGNSTYKALWGDVPWELAMDAACVHLATLAPRRSPRRSDDPLSSVASASKTSDDQVVHGHLHADQPPTASFLPEELKAISSRIDLSYIRSLDASSLLGVSVGFLAEVVSEATTLKEIKGRKRYEQAAQRALSLHKSFAGEVEVDGVTLASGSIDLVAIGGARYRGGVLNVLPHSILDDGLLDVCVLYDLTSERFLQVMVEAIAGKHLGMPGVAYVQGYNVHISTKDRHPIPVEHDGERDADINELYVSVLPGVVEVLRKQ